MTINPCKRHPDAKEPNLPRRYIKASGRPPLHGTGCPICLAECRRGAVVDGNVDRWNDANPLPPMAKR